MDTWNGKSKGNVLGYKIFVGILKRMGVLPAYFLLRFVALYYFLFSFKSSTITYHYFRQRLGFGRVKSLFKVYKNYFLFGQSLIDRVVLMSGIPNKFTINFDGENNLRKIIELKKGGLLLSAHIGNWEIAGYLFKRLNTKVNIVMFDGEDSNIKEYMQGIVEEKSFHTIYIKNDLSHIYEISEAFQNNEIVCMHADRFMENNKTYTIDFLGRKAKFPAGPFALAANFKVPVSFVFSLKETKLHYHFFATPAKNYSGFNKKLQIQQMLQDFVSEVEDKVKKYPEQWYNYYEFWQ